MPYNLLCLYPDARQGTPGSGQCNNLNNNTARNDNCLTAVDIQSARDPKKFGLEPARTRGGGCKNDGGPLWITVELVEEEDGVVGPSGGFVVPRTIYGRIFQKASKKTSSRRSRKSSRYAQIESTEDTSDLVECMALQLCSASCLLSNVEVSVTPSTSTLHVSDETVLSTDD